MSADPTEGRTPTFQRNAQLESCLEELNRLLAGAELSATVGMEAPELPSVFLLGNARSGSTLALQWLAASGVFAYPTNLLSRFFRVPYIGALVQRVLTDPRFAFQGELGDFQRPLSFASTMGKTTGALAPHEFWYFWRRFFPGNELRPINESAVSSETIAELRRELAAMESLEGRPLAMKALHMNFNVPLFARIFPRAVFVHLRRSPLHNIQSLLEARVRQFGSVHRWYSVQPPEFEQLRALEPVAQVAGQVFHVNRHIATGLSALPPDRRLALDYESLCAAPAAAFDAIVARMRAQGWTEMPDYRGPASFTPGNTVRLSPEDHARAAAAWRELNGEDLDAWSPAPINPAVFS